MDVVENVLFHFPRENKLGSSMVPHTSLATAPHNGQPDVLPNTVASLPTPARGRAFAATPPPPRRPVNHSPPHHSPLRISPRLLVDSEMTLSQEVSVLKLKHTTTRMNWLFYHARAALEEAAPGSYAKMGTLKKIKAVDLDEENLLVELVFPAGLMRQNSSSAVPASPAPVGRGRSPAPAVKRPALSPAPTPARNKTPAARRTPLAKHLLDSSKRRRLGGTAGGEGTTSTAGGGGASSRNASAAPELPDIVEEGDATGGTTSSARNSKLCSRVRMCSCYVGTRNSEMGGGVLCLWAAHARYVCGMRGSVIELWV